MAKPARVTKAQVEAVREAAAAERAVITASDVWRFENDNEIVGSNILVGSGIVDTLENCASVVAFLWHYQGLEKASEIEPRAESGLSLITELVLDALSKQLDALEPGVTHGG
jgi:hypothetical protein